MLNVDDATRLVLPAADVALPPTLAAAPTRGLSLEAESMAMVLGSSVRLFVSY